MTPIEIIDELVYWMYTVNSEWEPQNEYHSEWQLALLKARERINKECTVQMSTDDNTYNIPYWLVEEFKEDNAKFEEFQEETDSWYELCDRFDSKYSQYQV